MNPCRTFPLLSLVLLSQLSTSGVCAGKVDTGVKILAKILRNGGPLASLAAKNEPLALKLTSEMGEAGAQQFLAKLGPDTTELLVRHGEITLPMLRATGPAGGRWLQEFGDDILPVWEKAGNGTAAWIGRHGADGVRVAGRHGVEAAESLFRGAGRDAFPVVLEMGRPAIQILEKTPGRLSMMQAVIREGQKEPFLVGLGRHGEDFLKFVERNWKGMGIAAACVAFATQPRAFTEPAADVASGAIRHAMDNASRTILGVATHQPLVFLASTTVFVAGLLLLSRRYLPILKTVLSPTRTRKKTPTKTSY